MSERTNEYSTRGMNQRKRKGVRTDVYAGACRRVSICQTRTATVLPRVRVVDFNSWEISRLSESFRVFSVRTFCKSSSEYKRTIQKTHYLE